MADDTQTNDKVEIEGEVTPTESPAVEEPEAKVEGVEEEVATESETPEAEADRSPRAKSREHELARKVKEKDEEARSLKEELEQYKGSTDQSQADSLNQAAVKDSLPWLDQSPEEDKNLTVEDYKRDVLATADRIVNIRLQEQQTKTQRSNALDSDVDYLEGKYPELKKGSEGFNPQISKQVTNLYAKARQGNPDLRMKDFIDPIMSLRQAGEDQGREASTEAISKQNEESAITPTATSSKRKSSEQELIEQMKRGEISIDEVDSILSQS